jgi:hypothetical protein
MVTNLVKVVRLNNKSSAHVALQFENMWLVCYPPPQHCIYDQGGKFIGWPFQQVLLCHHIAGHPTTAKKAQANSVCERMHQAIGNALRVLSTLQLPQGIVDANQLVDTDIANAIFAS